MSSISEEYRAHSVGVIFIIGGGVIRMAEFRKSEEAKDCWMDMLQWSPYCFGVDLTLN